MLAVLVVILSIAAVIGAVVLLAVRLTDRSMARRRRYVPLVVPVREQAIEPALRAVTPVRVAHSNNGERSQVSASEQHLTSGGVVETVVFHDAYVEPPARSSKQAETVRFRRPVEEPVQLLPGRLEVVSGEARHREIRFVRVPGEPLQLVVGRDPGAPSPRHVTLQSSTVSRQHAQFNFSDGKWAVANLSRTNPVIVNDEHLSDTEGERTLVDGDRIELGEVVLRFRAH
jgi:FHA domain-containing protein